MKILQHQLIIEQVFFYVLQTFVLENCLISNSQILFFHTDYPRKTGLVQ